MNSVDVDKHAGTCENVAWAFLPLPLLSSLVLLAVQIWGRSQLKEFEISSSGRSPRSAYTWAPLCNLYHRQERAAHLTAARSQGPEIVVLTGIGLGKVLPPQLWEPQEPQMGQSPTEEAADQARSWEPQTERGGWAGLAAETTLAAQQGHGSGAAAGD